MTVIAETAFPSARCAANRAAGKITYLTGFDYAASATHVDVFLAKAEGYYAKLCLDVVIKPSLSNQNYALIAGDEAQLASSGSYGELIDYAGRNDAQFQALAVEGRSEIDALITRKGAIASLGDVKGKKIGIRGALAPSVRAMLLQQGRVGSRDYATVGLASFDPAVNIATPNIIGFPGYKSNEPLQLTAAKVPFDIWDPAKFGIPGSFGVIYSNASFINKHPTAAEDFMRATMLGLHDAIADPASAVTEALHLLNANGNTQALSPDGEKARWSVESRIVASGSDPPGVPEMALLAAEVKSYADIGIFNGITPDYTTAVDPDMVKSLYNDSGAVIWPR